jgi:type II secretory pathway pseudopilin PulG
MIKYNKLINRLLTGQSLVEVVVALGVVILLVSGLIIGTTAVTRANQINRARSLATKYVQEAIEIVRHDRDNDWTSFSTLAQTAGTSYTYCLGQSETTLITNPVKSSVDAPDDTNYDLPASCKDNIDTGSFVPGSIGIKLKRSVTLIKENASAADNLPDRIDVTVKVQWRETSGPKTAKATTQFTNWR